MILPTPSPYLLQRWDALNADVFGGRLKRPAPDDVGWLPASEMQGADGRCGSMGSLAIHERFKVCEDVQAAIRAHMSVAPAKIAEAERLFEELLIVLIHEMVHQAVAQAAGRPVVQRHDEVFAAEANRLASLQVDGTESPFDLLPRPFEPCTPENAAWWPRRRLGPEHSAAVELFDRHGAGAVEIAAKRAEELAKADIKAADGAYRVLSLVEWLAARV